MSYYSSTHDDVLREYFVTPWSLYSYAWMGKYRIDLFFLNCLSDALGFHSKCWWCQRMPFSGLPCYSINYLLIDSCWSGLYCRFFQVCVLTLLYYNQAHRTLWRFGSTIFWKLACHFQTRNLQVSATHSSKVMIFYCLHYVQNHSGVAALTLRCLLRVPAHLTFFPPDHT